jgi:hypothetical protein
MDILKQQSNIHLVLYIHVLQLYALVAIFLTATLIHCTKNIHSEIGSELVNNECNESAAEIYPLNAYNIFTANYLRRIRIAHFSKKIRSFTTPEEIRRSGNYLHWRNWDRV